MNAPICFNATSESDTSFGYRNGIHESPCERGLGSARVPLCAANETSREEWQVQVNATVRGNSSSHCVPKSTVNETQKLLLAVLLRGKVSHSWHVYRPSAVLLRGELSYLAPLGSENISTPYFKQCFFRGGITPQTVKHHASQSQDRNNKYFILYIEFCINNKI